MPKMVEMFEDQRSIIEVLADKAKAGSYITIPAELEGTLRALVTAFDSQPYVGGSTKSEYERGYEAGYEQGDQDCMQSWTRSNRQRSGA